MRHRGRADDAGESVAVGGGRPAGACTPRPRGEGSRVAAARCCAACGRVAPTSLKATGVPEAGRVAPLIGGLVDGLDLRRLAVDGLRIGLAEASAGLVAGLNGSSAPE